MHKPVVVEHGLLAGYANSNGGGGGGVSGGGDREAATPMRLPPLSSAALAASFQRLLMPQQLPSDSHSRSPGGGINGGGGGGGFGGGGGATLREPIGGSGDALDWHTPYLTATTTATTETTTTGTTTETAAAAVTTTAAATCEAALISVARGYADAPAAYTGLRPPTADDDANVYDVNKDDIEDGGDFDGNIRTADAMATTTMTATATALAAPPQLIYIAATQGGAPPHVISPYVRDDAAGAGQN
jgi:hypothetical protein